MTRLDQAEDLLFQGRLEEATRLLDEALESDPEDARVQFLLGVRERFRGRPAAAARHHEKARTAQPREPRRHLYLAEALLRAGKTDACLAALSRGLRDCPPPKKDDAEGLIQRYRLAACAFEFERAASTGERLLDLKAGDARAAGALAWPVFHEHFELFRRPAAYRAAQGRALRALARTRPDSLWNAYFRILHLSYPGYSGRLRAEDFARVRAADARRYGWMRWEASRKAREGDECLDGPAQLEADLAAAAASGLRPPVEGEARRL